jgi:hypothetical protein
MHCYFTAHRLDDIAGERDALMMARQPTCDAEKKRLASAQAKVSEQYQEIDLLKKQLAAMKAGATIHPEQSSSVGELKRVNEKGHPRSSPHTATEGAQAGLHPKKVGPNSITVPPIHSKNAHIDQDFRSIVHKKISAEPGAGTPTVHSTSNLNQATALKEKKLALTPRRRRLRSTSAYSRGADI